MDCDAIIRERTAYFGLDYDGLVSLGTRFLYHCISEARGRGINLLTSLLSVMWTHCKKLVGTTMPSTLP